MLHQFVEIARIDVKDDEPITLEFDKILGQIWQVGNNWTIKFRTRIPSTKHKIYTDIEGIVTLMCSKEFIFNNLKMIIFKNPIKNDMLVTSEKLIEFYPQKGTVTFKPTEEMLNAPISFCDIYNNGIKAEIDYYSTTCHCEKIEIDFEED